MNSITTTTARAWPLRLFIAIALCAAAGPAALYGWSYRWLDRARSTIDSGSVAGADRDLLRFLRLHPNHAEAHLLLGLVFGHRRRWSDAIDQFRLVADDRPEAIEARWREGDAAFMANRFADSERSLQRALELAPHHVEVVLVLMQLYRWQEREFDARQLVWSAYEQVPASRRAALLAEWFRVRFAQFDAKATGARLRASLEFQPLDVESAAALARWHMHERDLGSARAMAEQSLEQNPRHIAARAALVACLLEQGDGPAAQRAIEEWPAEPRDQRFWSAHARWLQEHAMDYAGAAQSWRFALTDRPDDWESRYRLATCLRRLNQLDDAEGESAEALRIRDAATHAVVKQLLEQVLPRLADADSRARLGAFYESIGYAREAACWYEQALFVDREHRDSLAGVERLSAATMRRERPGDVTDQ